MSESESVAGTADCQSVRHQPKCRFVDLSALAMKKKVNLEQKNQNAIMDK